MHHGKSEYPYTTSYRMLNTYQLTFPLFSLLLNGLCHSSWCVQGLSLSSSPPSSEDGIISVCPATTVTLTCSASGVGSMGWRDQNKLIGSFSASDNEPSVIDKDPYTLTLVSIEKYDDEFLGNFTSTLEVMVDDITNGTNITCQVFRNKKYLLIYKTSKLANKSYL